MLGCLIAILVIALGRLLLASTVSTLSGWSALFFTAICSGLLCFNLLAKRPLTSERQMRCLILGCMSGVTALAFFEQHLDSTGTVFLVMTILLAAFSLLGLRHQKSGPQIFESGTLAMWAQRLDDLLKYDLPTGVRSTLVQLINTLWHSPQDRDNFIPAENSKFATLLNFLELAVRQGNFQATITTTDDLAKCLDERNRLLAKAITIEYRNLEVEFPKLNKNQTNERVIKGS